MKLDRGGLIVQREEDGMWYVQEVSLLDVGRFKTFNEALDHKAFLEENSDER
jgi:hypothetical protein